jgi:short-subunit dehydrogenase
MSPSHDRPVALVTGASSGIGAALTRQLAGRGHDLVVVARRTDQLKKLADELNLTHGTDVEVLAADLRDTGDLGTVEARLRDGSRPVDVLVNNAGFGSDGFFHELPLEGELGQIELNVVALVRLTHAALPGMVARRGGGVLNVSSAGGFQPAPKNATYVATKAYVTSFSQSIHEEVTGHRVRVTCLCPGFTKTEFQQTAGWDGGIVPDFLWMEADAVARAGLAALDRNDALCVPGLPYKVAAGAVHLLPRGVVRRLAGLATKRM